MSCGKTSAAPEPELELETASAALGRVTLVMQGQDGEAQELKLPVYSLADIEMDEVDFETLMPADVQHAFQRLGYEMNPSVEWTPLEVDDQRLLYVPTGRIQFTPATYRTSY